MKQLLLFNLVRNDAKPCKGKHKEKEEEEKDN